MKSLPCEQVRSVPIAGAAMASHWRCGLLATYRVGGVPTCRRCFDTLDLEGGAVGVEDINEDETKEKL